MSKFLDTNIGGVKYRAVQRFEDKRGFFQELYRESDFYQIIPEMLQDNLSYSQGSILRGMHFQESQWQILFVLKGAILDVTLDVGKTSSTFLQRNTIELNATKFNQLIIPPNVAHGFCTISDETILLYKSSKYYEESPQYGVLWNSPELMDCWPRKDWIISDRDKAFPNLKDFLSN